jgi:arylsulfatase A-like enzyme
MPIRSRTAWAGPAIAIAALVALAAGAASAAPPRVVVVTIDTLRADHVQAYGGSLPTPAMDAVARAGALVLDAYTPTPTTAPAHASLWTGLHPWHHGVADNAVPLRAELPTIPEQVRAAGIPTAAFVSSFILDARFGWSRGFDVHHFEPTEPYRWRGRVRGRFWSRAGPTTDAALAWLARHAHEGFLLWVHYFDPHAPYEAPPGFERPQGERVALDGKTLPPGIASLAQLTDAIRGYRGDVAYVDAQLGRLLDGVDALGVADSTTVVVTSDHGEGLGDHGLLEHGENLHEELVRIPLLIRGPGVAASRRLDGFAQLEDLGPTVLELMQLPAPPGADGTSLLAWLRGTAPHSPRNTVLGRRKPYRHLPDQLFARTRTEKWIGTPGGAGTAYRLDADPHELQGAPASEPPAAIARLGEALREPARAPELDAESRRALEALGYLER